MSRDKDALYSHVSVQSLLTAVPCHKMLAVGYDMFHDHGAFPEYMSFNDIYDVGAEIVYYAEQGPMWERGVMTKLSPTEYSRRAIISESGNFNRAFYETDEVLVCGDLAHTLAAMAARMVSNGVSYFGLPDNTERIK